MIHNLVMTLNISLALCGDYKFINNTSYPINKMDRETEVRAANKCEYEYRSCLWHLIKTGKRSYHAICK